MRTYIGYLTYAIILMSCLTSKGQNYSIYNSYFLNPYFYNPAEAATDFTYIHVNHRQQWMGMEGSPKITTASFTTLLDETRTGVGVRGSSYSRGLLQTNDFYVTYCYGIPVSPKNTFYFGLSGGAISNNIDVTEIDASDPIIANYLADNFQPAANFGMLLRMQSGLNFGVSLPQLFTPRFTSAANFENTDVSPNDNIVFSAYYRRKVDGKIVSKKKKGVRRKVKTNESFAPLEFYTLYRYSKTGMGQAEGTVKLNLSENFWIAGLYRQTYGFAGSLGFSFSNILINYSYEPGNQPQPEFSTGTHEIHLGLRLGELKKFKRIAPTLRSTLKSNAEQQHIARFQQSAEDPDHDLNRNEKDDKKKYYVVVKVFADFPTADAFKQKLVADKFNADIFYYEKDRKYYVHVFESSKPGEAHEEARNLKLYSKLKDARVLTVTIPKN